MPVRAAPFIMALGAAALMTGCGDDESGTAADFEFEERFDFEERANQETPNGATGPNNSGTNNGGSNNSGSNNTNNELPPPEPACGTRVLAETYPGSPAQIATTRRGAAAVFAIGDEVRVVDRYRNAWRPRNLRDPATVSDAIALDIAGTDEGNEWLWITTSTADGTSLWSCEDTCLETAKFDFSGVAQVYSNTRFAAYVGGLALDRPLPQYEIRFFSNGQTGLATFAEAPSRPSQYGFAPTSIPTNPQLRTEFRAAWDTGSGPLSFVSVNTSLLMELEPECNRLDLLGGRVVPLSSERGILVSSSGPEGPVLTWDACDGQSPPVFFEASRGVIDFDVATNYDDLETVDLYWIEGGSVWGTTIDASEGVELGPLRRIAAIPDAQFIRAAFNGDDQDGNAIVVTTRDGVVGTNDLEFCAEIVDR